MQSLRVALYARVSTADQTCEMQIRELREYAARRGWPIVAEYVDTGWSGAKASRPELNKLKAEARKRAFDCVIVWKLDRWGRSVTDSISGINELVSLGVRFVAMTQNLDTDESNPMARFFLHIMAAFAELEREMIRERVRAGLATAKAKGRKLGRQPVIYNRGKALELRTAGRSIRQIAKEVDVSVGTIQRLLEANPLLDVPKTRRASAS